MWNFIRILFSSLFTKTIKKTYIDARLGKMICSIDVKGEEFFFWNAEVFTLNKKEPTTISVEGDINGPDLSLLQKTYSIIAEIEDFIFIVQKELDYKFTDQKLNLLKDYYIDDISLYIDEDLDFEMEFYTDIDNKAMVSVAFNDKNIVELDLY